ncbi:autotransporter domain-containing protein [Pontiella agarivorans]|uniref:Autotransporter domain-containing protein n=1 Tax=Pontiella agarivorans TaxID=3038953 RepID=A0ABU5MX01_9BACT|nr:autotransporter domain-containing protein [Pontiella agarivorans]MDZ8118750.1 autotransporter domain-containing protein [Pontiella agarivorans]
MTRFLKILGLSLALSGFAQAQYTNVIEGGQTVPVSSDWNNGGTNLIVGGTSGGNTLNINTGYVVSNSSEVVIGRDAGAAGNTVSLDGSGLLVNGDLTVGRDGNDNRLMIDDESYVENTHAYVGANSDGNAVSVTDYSVWNNQGTLYLDSGSGNSVSVSGGGQVLADSLQLSADNTFNLNQSGVLLLRSDFNASTAGFSWNTGGHLYLTNGTLSGLSETNGITYLHDARDLTLNDSDLDASGTDLTVGNNGSNSDLQILNGGTVEADNGIIGSGSDAANNSIMVSGEDSSLRFSEGGLKIGVDAGTGNALGVFDGAWTFVGDAAEGDVAGTTNGGLIVAHSTGATLELDNSARVSVDGGLFVGTAGGGTGTVTVENGSSVSVGTVDIEDGSSIELQDAGSFSVAGDFIYGNDMTKFIWGNNTTLGVGGTLTRTSGLDGTQRTLNLNGGDWALADSTVVSGVSNTVQVLDGGSLTTTSGLLSGTNNAVVVSGSDSQWENTGFLYAEGTNNSVSVASGGKVSATGVDFDDGNVFNINSGGTLALTTNLFDWSAAANINWNSGGNLALINGEFTGLDSTNLVFNGATNSAVSVGNGRSLTLENGTWDDHSTDHLVVGLNRSGETISISNKTTMAHNDAYIGWGSGSGGNSVVVSDADTLWEVQGGDLYIGAYWANGTNLTGTGGNDNYLYVRDGAQVFVGDATTNEAGVLVASSGGASMTLGDGRVEIDDTLFIGQGVNTGAVTIMDGGDMRVGDLEIAAGSELDLQENGIFRISNDLNMDALAGNGFDWYSTNSTIQVDGTLTRSDYFLDKEQNLILGTNGLWNTGGADLIVGVDGNSKLTVRDTGELNAGNITIGGAVSNSGSSAVIVDGGGVLNATDVTIGAETDSNYLEISDQGSVNLLGSVYLGGTNSTGNYVLLDGSNTTMNIGGDLLVGAADTNSAENVFYLQNKAELTVDGDVSIFGGNRMALNGATNSVGGDFTVYSNAMLTGTGEIKLTDTDAVLVLENGNMAIDEDGALGYTVSSGVSFAGTGSNQVKVDGGIFGLLGGSTADQYSGFDGLTLNGTEFYGYGTNNFSSVSMINGTIRPSSNLGATTLSTGKYTLIDTAGTLVFNGAFSASNTTYKAGVLGEYGHDLLHFAQNVTLDGLIADITVASVTNSEMVILSSDVGLSGDFAETNLTNHMLLFDASLVKAGNEMKVIMTNTTDTFSSSLDYAASESIRAGFNGMKNAVFTRTKQLRRNLVSTAHSMPHDAFLMTNTNAPAGPQGPGAENTIFDMHVWAQYFNGQGDYSAHGSSDSYTLNNSGTTLGADKLVGEDLTVGLNYTYVQGDAQTANTDYLDTETYWFGAYGEWVGKNGLYIDTLLAYGRSNYDSIRVENDNGRDYRGTASYRGDNFGGYVDVGQYMYYKNLAIAPYAGLHVLFMNTGDHTETSTADANDQLKISSMSRNLVESALGLKARHRFDTSIGRFQTTGYAEWTHDFVQDEIATEMQQVNDILGLNTAAVTQAAIKPDEDLFNVGLGLSWRSTEYMEIGIGYNGRFSDDYEEHTGSLMLDVMF